ncbi:hypothetical protein PNOK_0612500 [Pyrrhoderma noxium]|uniref:Uncharacterized protein n=1 Tax=Pyrrhoderma noxium TaxID=2282107 RepID=A0A286UDP9_9AGAM|nr:hypothetical protein PNOK_0612500 [Pyrrhoderma noxium]
MAFTTHAIAAESSVTVNSTFSACSAATVTGGSLPPTRNIRDSAERSRLIRSSRKLGKVLGTTPAVIERDSYFPPSFTSPATLSRLGDTQRKRASAPPSPISFAAFSAAMASAGDSELTRIVSQSSSASDKDSDSEDKPYHSRKTSAPLPFLIPSFPGIEMHWGKQKKDISKNSSAKVRKNKDKEVAKEKVEISKSSQPVMSLPPVKENISLDERPASGPSSVPIVKDSEGLSSGSASETDTSITTPVSPTPPSSGLPSLPADIHTHKEHPTDQVGSLANSDISDCLSPIDDDVVWEEGYKVSEADLDEARIRKRRMDKLMRHLGEYVPSELVLGTAPRRASTPAAISVPDASITIPKCVTSPPPIPPSPTSITPKAEILPTTSLSRSASTSATVTPISASQARILRRISVVSASANRRRLRPQSPANIDRGCITDGSDGYASGPEPATKSMGLGALRNKTLQLVEDEWTPEAYEDVVTRLRKLK